MVLRTQDKKRIIECRDLQFQCIEGRYYFIADKKTVVGGFNTEKDCLLLLDALQVHIDERGINQVFEIFEY